MTDQSDPDDDIWGDDLLNRKAEAEFLLRFLQGRHTVRLNQGLPFSHVVNLDADWGYGKSFFLDRLGKQLRAEGHIVAEVNAWESDFAEDPLLPVMASVENALRPYLGQREVVARWQAVKANIGAIAQAAAVGVAKAFAAKYVPGMAEAISGAIMADQAKAGGAVVEAGLSEATNKAVATVIDSFAKGALEEHQKLAATISNFRRDLADVLSAVDGQNVPMPMYILVDELDRCRPTYAVTMLERIKHLFDVENVVFLVATNTRELVHSISAVYGNNFDGARYLNRFFDVSYSLAAPDEPLFIVEELAAYPGLTMNHRVSSDTGLARYLAEIFRAFDLSTRDRRQLISMLALLYETAPNKGSFIWGVMVPLLCAHQLRLPATNLTEARDALMARLKYDKWRMTFHGRGTVVSVGVLGILEMVTHLLSREPKELLNMDASTSLEAHLLSELADDFEGGIFGVAQYLDRIRQAGRITSRAPATRL